MLLAKNKKELEGSLETMTAQLLWFECEMSLEAHGFQRLVPEWWSGFWKAVEPLGDGASQEEVGPRGEGLEV